MKPSYLFGFVLIKWIYGQSFQIQQTFREFPNALCDNFQSENISFARSKTECISSCTENCLGVSFAAETKECQIRTCRLGYSIGNKDASCYLIGNEFCSKNVTLTKIELPETETQSYLTLSSDEKCLAVPLNQVKVLQLDLGAQFLVSHIEIDTYNFHSAYLDLQTVLYFPTDPSIDVTKFRGRCLGNVTATSNDPFKTVQLNCTSCSFYGRYITLLINIYKSTSSGDVGLCGLKISGCETVVI